MGNFILSQQQLEGYAQKFMSDNYNMDLGIPLIINARLKTSYGLFRSRGSKKPVRLDLNKWFVENNSPEIVLDVLRHELVHYALCAQGHPYSDGDAYFEQELKRLGVVSQYDIDNGKVNVNNKPRKIITYECTNCGLQYRRKRKLRNDGINHSCGKCRGEIKNIGVTMEVS